MDDNGITEDQAVHCRIGSLEINGSHREKAALVHCRIGSLEIPVTAVLGCKQCSLPHRQLRNMAVLCSPPSGGSLPHRQLRKDFWCDLTK